MRGLEIIFELVIQVVVEVLGELLIEVGFHGAARVLRSWVGRVVVLAVPGLIFGVWWGDRLSEVGHHPRLLWVSIALAGVSALALVASILRRRSVTLPDPQPGGPWWRALVQPPWMWGPQRFVTFLACNVAIAAGILIGYQPLA